MSGLTDRSTRTRSGIAPRGVLASLRHAAQCHCAPVNSDVRPQVTREDAFDLVRASVARGTSIPSFGPSPEEYTRSQTDGLLEALIEPEPVRVVGETYSYGVLAELRSETVLAIAREDTKWLLYRPAKGEFCMAYGQNQDDLTIWGFSSADALAEWLG